MSAKTNWKDLQNGPDIRGVALEGIAGQPVSLTPEITRAIGAAFVVWLRKRCRGKETLRICVGRDSRISGPKLKDALIDGLCSSGAQVGDAGLASTPAMFMSTVFEGHKYDAAIMLTASHLPFNRNGMKFFTGSGGLEKQDITDLLDLAEQGGFEASGGERAVRQIDLMNDYAAFLVERIRGDVDSAADDARPLSGLKIVVDAGNGAGGFFAHDVLGPLGADTSGSQYLDPDGMFPNHIPNPEDGEAMQSIRQAVLRHGADFGVIFDTDVDRAAAVDGTGQFIHRNRLIGLISAIILEEHPGSTIVTDSITSDGLHRFIEETLGGRHHRFKRGYRNVINEAKRLNEEGQETHLAIETSGHAALKENYFLDDGAYLITKLLTKMARMRQSGSDALVSLIESMPEPVESREFRITIDRPDFKEYGKNVIGELSDFVGTAEGWSVVPCNYEGIRVSCGQDHGDGWFLLRLSLHDPVLPLNVESEQASGVRVVAARLITFLEGYSDLDTTAIRTYLEQTHETE
jgi:phosphomannomutase